MLSYIGIILVGLNFVYAQEWLANGKAIITETTCDDTQYKCSYSFATKRMANANLSIELSYGILTGKEMRIDVRISKLGPPQPFNDQSYQDEYRFYYDLDDPELYKYEKKTFLMNRVSESASRFWFDRGDYNIENDRSKLKKMITCPILYFLGLEIGVRSCIEIKTEDDRTTIEPSTIPNLFAKYLRSVEEKRIYQLLDVKNRRVIEVPLGQGLTWQ